MKYLIFTDDDGAAFPLMFFAPITHMEIALMVQSHRPGRHIVSAGFLVFTTPSEPRCFGRSESLGLDARPAEDSQLISSFVKAALG